MIKLWRLFKEVHCVYVNVNFFVVQGAFGSIGGGDPLQAALGMAVGGGSVPTQQTPVKQSGTLPSSLLP